MFVNENVNDILKAKDQNAIDEELNNLIQINNITDRLEEVQGVWFCLYIEENDWSGHIYSTKIEKIIEKYKNYACEAYKNDWSRFITIYAIDITKDYGTLFIERGESYDGDCIKTLAEIEIVASYTGTSKIDIYIK